MSINTRKKRKSVTYQCWHKIITEFQDTLYYIGTYDIYECIMCWNMRVGEPK